MQLQAKLEKYPELWYVFRDLELSDWGNIWIRENMASIADFDGTQDNIVFWVCCVDRNRKLPFILRKSDSRRDGWSLGAGVDFSIWVDEWPRSAARYVIVWNPHERRIYVYNTPECGWPAFLLQYKRRD